MISLRNFISVGLAGLSLLACGSDDAAGGGTVNPADCSAVAAKQKSLSAAAGCKDTSSDYSTICSGLYSAKKCTNEWAALINCISPRPASDFQCDADNELEPKTGICTSQQDALSSCV